MKNVMQLNVDIKIDITTGDKITPAEIRYHYPKLLSDSYIEIYAYNIETILAEKKETLLMWSLLRDLLKILIVF